MKRVWLSVISLSIIGNFFDLCGQEAVMPNRGEGSCWRKVRDGVGGPELFEFLPTSDRCGWFTVSQISRVTAGSSKGWNGYIKIVNQAKPTSDFYLGSTFPMRSLMFGKGSRIACYKCKPETNTSCLPNDPVRIKECFTPGSLGAISCETQVDCSQVIEITECYSQGEGGAFSLMYNDLDLCPMQFVNTLENLSGAGRSTYQARDIASSVTPPGQPQTSYEANRLAKPAMGTSNLPSNIPGAGTSGATISQVSAGS